MSTNEQIEAEIKAKGKTAARITPSDIEANIACETYFTAHDGATGASINNKFGIPSNKSLELLTFCVLTLRNGFTVTGESACASPENFDAEIGRKVARSNAIEKIWPLMGYELKSRLADNPQPKKLEWIGICKVESTHDHLEDATRFLVKTKDGDAFNFVMNTLDAKGNQLDDQAIRGAIVHEINRIKDERKS